MGRMITQFVLPFFLWIYNTAVSSMKYFNIYLFSKDTVPLILSVLLVNIGFFILILIMSLRYGRLYCNSLCPVGTLLGLISRVSLFKFAIDKTRCNECLSCAAVCKAGCIDTQNAMIDQSRCVGCFNCLSACPQSIVSYRSSVKNREGDSWSPARRGFLIGSSAAAGSALFMFNSGIRNLLRTAHASTSRADYPARFGKPGTFYTIMQCLPSLCQRLPDKSHYTVISRLRYRWIASADDELSR